ncbi:MAG: pyridoxal phosphate-dependent aminotransferase [Candidatus Andersenbacteria bacterium]
MSTSFSIRELAERAKREGAIDLAQGVVDAPPPQVLIESLQQLPLSKNSTYNNKRGVLEYRQAIQQYLATRGWQLSLGSIMATAGAMGGIVSALLTECRPGSRVLLPEPFFVYHKLLLEVLGFEPVFFPVPLDREPDWEALAAKMQNVAVAILTTPANPTGQLASPVVLKMLSEAATARGCLLIVDEMYREFIWNQSVLADDNSYNDLKLNKMVIVRSFSKTLCIPGWRVGFAITTPERIEAMAPRHDALYIGGSTIAQYAVAKTLTDNLSEITRYIADLQTQLQDNRKMLATAFRQYGMEPLPVTATYYMLIKHNRESDIAAMEELIAKKVVVTPVNILFSDPSQDTGYIRIHFAISQENCQKVASILT